MDPYLIQSLIVQGKLVSPSQVDANSVYLPVGVYQSGNRKLASGNDAYPLYAIPLSSILGGGAVWGGITGTLSSQTDLQAALNSKYDASNPSGFISGITSGDVTAALGFTPYDSTNPANYIDATALAPYLTTATAIANYQPLLGFTPEDVANKSIDGTLSANSDALYPSQKSVKTYVDASVSGVLDDRGNWDASTNLFPTTGGSGPGGSILKGDLWFVSVAGILGGTPVVVGNNFRALVDNPTLSTDWNILNVGLGFIPENSANKGIANGYASLDATGKVPASQIKYKTLIRHYGSTANQLYGVVGSTRYYLLNGVGLGPYTFTSYPLGGNSTSFFVPKTGTITAAKIFWYFNNASSPYTQVQQTLTIRNINTNTTHLVTNTLQLGIGLTGQGKTFLVSGLNIPVTEDDKICSVIEFPPMLAGTNPIGLLAITIEYTIE
jgi:hypothetical protein